MKNDFTRNAYAIEFLKTLMRVGLYDFRKFRYSVYMDFIDRENERMQVEEILEDIKQRLGKL